MVKRMKAIALNQGIETISISAKSLRKALGTDLTNSHVLQDTINAIGRWTEKSTVYAEVYAMALGEITGAMSQGVKTVIKHRHTTNEQNQKHTGGYRWPRDFDGLGDEGDACSRVSLVTRAAQNIGEKRAEWKS